MGPLFQLIIVGILYILVACFIGVVLILIARLITAFKKNTGVSVNHLFWFPIKLLPYFLLAIIANVLVCEFIRDVDPPLTDYWTLTINGELTLGAIDTSYSWSLWPSKDGGEAIISDITLAGKSDEAFYGSTETGEYFIYDLKINQKTFPLSEDQFETEVKDLVGALPKLSSPSELYYDNRHLGDLITFLVLLVYPLYRFYKVCSIFWRELNQQNSGFSSGVT
ncbi:hypothetical protein P20652_4111 [Pseudoalteromonas sp. BSi20652]|uniref:hypothetical protein n=1 Tax=Pseudoalteromonas sp. BSi20652 TaxID=388384 RepID=UPI0002316B45|nr:hypothetical protein [Pseudoalteromonas sp. BSi20652]GAA62208.1 hypothetical protein P20652_4111 [Pseudoalteromonas sp. BSi20652]